MRLIKYESEITDPYGDPVYLPDPHPEIQQAARSAAIKAGQVTYDVPMVRATFAGWMLHFLRGMPFERIDGGRPKSPLTLEDSGHGFACVQAFRRAEADKASVVRLTAEDASWLETKLKSEGVAGYGIGAQVLLKRLLDFTNEAEQKE